MGRARDRREEIERKKREAGKRHGKEDRGERFVWGPGDIQAIYSPSGKYPPGQRPPAKKDPKDKPF